MSEDKESAAIYADDEKLSRRQFAEYLSCAPSHIVTLCQQGKIPVYHDEANGPVSPISEKFKTGYLIFDEALKAYNDFKHPGKEHVRERHAEKRGHELNTSSEDGPRESQSVSPLDESGDGQTSPDDSEKGTNVVTFADAKARKAAVEAELQELNLLEKTGKVCDVPGVENAAQIIGIELKNSLSSLGFRLSDTLAGISDPAEINNLLNTEVNKILNDLSTELSSIGDKVRT